MKTPFITVLRSNDRFLMRSPVLPELFAEGSGPEQTIERLGNVLQLIVKEYDKSDRRITLSPQAEPDRTTGAETSRTGIPFVEVRPEGDNRYLMTSPTFPELIVEGRGINQAASRLIHALRVVLNLYTKDALMISLS